VNSDSFSDPPGFSLAQTEPSLASLDERVGRLEQAVAGLQQRRPEDRPQVKAGPPFYEDKVRAGEPPNPASQTVSQTSETAPPAAAPEPPRPPWLLLDIAAEIRTMVRMFFDRRYHVAWSTWLCVLILLPMIFFSEWWFLPAQIWWVGGYLNRALDLILAFVLYKALSREARRYRNRRSA
jgi:hypothetical protein